MSEKSIAQRAPAPPGQILAQLAAADPGAPMLVSGDRVVTRREVDERAHRLAWAYDDLGVGEGDTVAIGLPNSVEFYEACFAVWRVGAVPLPLSWRLPDRERDEILQLANPKLVVGGSSPCAGFMAVPPGFEPGAVGGSPYPLRTSARWRMSTSSGSTGRPKLIVAAMGGAVSPDLGRSMRMRPDMVQLVAGPLYHSSAFVWSMAGAYLGQTLVLLPRFDAKDALQAIATHRVNWTCVVPTMLSRMLRELDDAPGVYDLSSVEVLWHMGAPCPPWLKERWIDLIGAERIYEFYGMTEALGSTEISGTDWLTHRGSVGRPRRGQLKIVLDDGSDAPPGIVGDVYMRPDPSSVQVPYEYIGAESRPIDGGWETVGDVGYVDEDGFLYLGDRRPDMVLVGGANVFPAEIEGALAEHPAVLSVVVVGLPDADLGQRLHAVVQAASAVEPEVLLDFLRARLAVNKLPRSFRFVDEPLRDEAGKVRRSAVRAREIELLGLEA